MDADPHDITPTDLRVLAEQCQCGGINPITQTHGQKALWLTLARILELLEDKA